jgi:hypothetical protein
MYKRSVDEVCPVRQQLHPRHRQWESLTWDRKRFGNQIAWRNSFLNHMLPSDYVSRIVAPEGTVDGLGDTFSLDNPGNWVYPTAKSGDGEDGVHDPNNHYGGVPKVADEECLKRANIPWTQKKGTKVYLKVCSELC